MLRGMSWVLRALLLLLLSIRGKPLLLPPTSPSSTTMLLRVGFTDRQARLVLRKVRPSDVSGLLRQLFGGGSSGDGENEEDGEGGFLTREQAIYLCTAYPTALLAPSASEASRRWCWHRKYWAVCGAGFDRCLCGARPSSSLFSSSSLLLSSTLTASLPPPLTPVAELCFPSTPSSPLANCHRGVAPVGFGAAGAAGAAAAAATTTTAG